ncbi:bile acid:sodium symporter family protein [Psittacicella gerlachiana]|uniref:Sodium transporter n=1 Tax=Psittacicella gerlachiana TaxID=2028574 RepID=A0A3A1YCP5_9GAMM|nr:bile acid:sodium symporter family protein [Psittacicella gerlachiana]RIY36033.1 sodium transporter [Psittacicella gerlachiana]
MQALQKFNAFLTKTYALWIVFFATMAYLWPEHFKFALPYMTYGLGLIMFGMGMTLTFKDFALVVTQPKAVIVGCLAQFTIMPLSAYFLAVGFNLPPELAAGLILLGACPGGTVSNIMTYVARGNVALSVTMTSVCTLLSPVLTPTIFFLLASQWLEINPWGMFRSVLEVILLPIVLGVVVRLFFRRQVSYIVQGLPVVSFTCIVCILAGIIAVNAENISRTGVLVFFLVIVQNAIGFGLGFLVARLLKLDLYDSKAISIEVGMQSSALGVALANAHLTPIAAIPSAVAALWHNVAAPMLASYFSRLKDPRADAKEAADAKAKKPAQEPIAIED